MRLTAKLFASLFAASGFALCLGLAQPGAADTLAPLPQPTPMPAFKLPGINGTSGRDADCATRSPSSVSGLPGEAPASASCPRCRTPGGDDWAPEDGQPFPDGVQEILRGCLARHPEARYQSTKELHTALASIHDPGAWTRQDAERFWAAADRARFG